MSGNNRNKEKDPTKRLSDKVSKSKPKKKKENELKKVFNNNETRLSGGDRHHATFNFVVPASPNSSVSSSSSVSAKSILGDKDGGIYFGHKTNEETGEHTDFKGSANKVLSPKSVSYLKRKVSDGEFKATVSSLNIRSYHGEDKKNDTYTYQGRIVVKPTSDNDNSERKIDNLERRLLYYQEESSKK